MNNIQQLRIAEKNNVSNDIKTTISSIKHSKDTILRFKQGDNYSSFSLQIEKLQQLIKDREEGLINLEERYKNIELGRCDDELVKIANSNKEIVIEKNKIEKSKKTSIEDDKKQQKEMSFNYYKSDNDSKKQDRYSEKNKDKEESKYYSICETIPDYMFEKLETMPCNRGYIWKGIHLYGMMPAEFLEDDKRESLIMFDKKNKDLTVIHEWKNNNYSMYNKVGTRKNLVFTRPRGLSKSTTENRDWNLLVSKGQHPL